MDVIIERACGMDVHKDNILACIMTPEGKEIQTFSMKTVFLIQLVDWIKQHGCTHVVNLLEAEDIEFLVVNAQHIKAVPGRKTDVKDAEWIAQLVTGYSKRVISLIEINGNYETKFQNLIFMVVHFPTVFSLH